MNSFRLHWVLALFASGIISGCATAPEQAIGTWDASSYSSDARIELPPTSASPVQSGVAVQGTKLETFPGTVLPNGSIDSNPEHVLTLAVAEYLDGIKVVRAFLVESPQQDLQLPVAAAEDAPASPSTTEMVADIEREPAD